MFLPLIFSMHVLCTLYFQSAATDFDTFLCFVRGDWCYRSQGYIGQTIAEEVYKFDFTV